jgi:anti-sigma regulatory factor (Ser/Thr protein kinase)
MKHRALFPTCPDSEFFGRVAEIDSILRRAASEERPAPSILLFGGRWTGKTEILRRVFHNLFWGQARVVPVYYQFKGYGTVEDFSEDYLKEVLKQYLAFRMREPKYVRDGISLDKIEKLLVDNDMYDLADIAALHREARKAGDASAALKNAMHAPSAITRLSGIPVYMVLDDIDLAEYQGPSGRCAAVARELISSLSSSDFSFVAAASSKRVLEGNVFGSIEAMELTGLDEELSASMMTDLSRQYNVESDTEMLRLAAFRLDGNPMYLKSLVWAAAKSGLKLKTLKDFADLYTQELFDGNIGFALRAAMGLKSINDLRVLHACSVAAAPVSDEELMERFRFSSAEMREILGSLSEAGLVEVNLGSVKWAGDSTIKDFVYFIYETRVKGRSSDEVRTYLAREVLKQGFDFKGSRINVRLSSEASDIVKSFNNQKVLKVLFKNQAFVSKFKNGSYKVSADRREDEELELPQVVGCFDTARLESGEAGPPILVGHGFQNGRYDSGSEVVWIVSVKDSLSPVNLGDVDNFLRRSQILRENFRAARVVRWMIGRDGFTAEAQKKMEAEGVHSSDAVQLRIIKEGMTDPDGAGRMRAAEKIVPVKEFEVVIPSATKAELVAARAVEEIGTEMGFDDVAIGQIKAALVEACINGFEHSRNKSAKVFLRFVSSVDRLTIYVQNGGVDFDRPGAPAVSEPSEGLPRKRGWGFELMRGLMDEVRMEKVRGGAKIVLVKYLVKKGDSRNGQQEI